MQLRPGQRHPTAADIAEALWDEGRLGGDFPLGERWEITRAHAVSWFLHNFTGRRGDTNRFRQLADLADDEFALLLWDLDCYADLLRQAELGRGPAPPPIHEYLRPGREEWGLWAQLARSLNEVDGDGAA